MDDKLLQEALEAQGYSMNWGVITDSEGNYVPEVEVLGQTIKSQASEDSWKEEKEIEKNSQPIKSWTQEIEDYEKDPINNVLSKEAKRFYDETYVNLDIPKEESKWGSGEILESQAEKNAIQEKKDNNEYFDASLKQWREFEELYGDEFTKEEGDELKKILSEKNKFEEKYKEDLKNGLWWVDVATKEDWKNTLDNKDSGFFTKAGVATVNAVDDMTEWFQDYFGGEGNGIEDEKDKKRYEELVAEKAKYVDKISLKHAEILNQQREEIKQFNEQEGLSEEDKNALEAADYQIQKELGRIEDSVSDNVKNLLYYGDAEEAVGIAAGAIVGGKVVAPLATSIATAGAGTASTGIGAVPGAVLVATAGLVEALGVAGGAAVGGYLATIKEHRVKNTRVKLEKRINDKLQNNKKLTPIEKMYAKSFSMIRASQGSEKSLGAGYHLVEGLQDSSKLIVTLGVGGGKKVAVNVYDKLIKKGLPTFLASASQTGVKTMVSAIQTAPSSTMIRQSVENEALGHISFNGKDEKGEYTYTTDEIIYQNTKNQITTALENLEQQKMVVEDAETLKEINKQIKELREIDYNLIKPKTVEEATIRGYASHFTEAFSEGFVGPGISSVGKLGKRGLQAAGIVGKQTKKLNKIKRALDKMNLGKKFNKYAGGKLVGGVFEEFPEEIFSNIAPMPFDSDKERDDKMRELYNGSFYLDIAMNVAAMQGIVGTMGAAGGSVGTIKKYNKNKDLKNLVKQYANDVVKGKVSIQEMLEMKVKLGMPNTTAAEWQYLIDNTKTETDADGNVITDAETKKQILKEDMIFNEAWKLLQIEKATGVKGLSSSFIGRLKKQVTSAENQDSEAVKDLLATIEVAEKLKKDTKAYSHLANAQKIYNLKHRQHFIKRNIQEQENILNIYKAKGDLNAKEQQKVDNTKEYLKGLKYVDNKITSELNHETSEKRVEELEKRSSIKRTILKDFKKAKHSKDSQKALKNMQDNFDTRYGKVLHEKDSKVLKKNLESMILAETLKKNQEMSKAKQEEVEKKTEAESPTESKEVKQEVQEEVKEQEKTEEQNKVVQEEKIEEKEPESIQEEYEKEPELSEPSKEEEPPMFFESNVEPEMSDPSESRGEVVETLTLDDVAEKAGAKESLELLDKAGEELQVQNAIDDTEVFEEDDEALGDMPLDKESLVYRGLKGFISQMESYNQVPMSFEDLAVLLYSRGSFGKGADFIANTPLLAAVYEDITGRDTKLDKLASAQELEIVADLNDLANTMFGPRPTLITNTAQDYQVIKKQGKEIQHKVSQEAPLNKIGGEYNYDETAGEKQGNAHVIHYSSIEHKNEVVKVNGKTKIIKVEEKYETLNNSHGLINIKHLLHPKKNNIGDKLKVGVIDAKKLPYTEIVTKRDAYGIPTEVLPFNDWVKASMEELGLDINKDSDLEAFTKTDTYIDNVPITYKDAGGNDVAFVEAVGWHSLYHTEDTSLEKQKDIDYDNPTQHHLKTVEKNQKEARKLRRKILEGKIQEVKITDNLGPGIFAEDKADVVPTSLLKRFPDSQVVFVTKGGIIDVVNGKQVDVDNILNMDSYSTEKYAGRPFFMVKRTEVDGVEKFEMLPAFNRNENNEDGYAHQQDIDTASWLVAAHKTLLYAKTPTGVSIADEYSMTYEEAELIEEQLQEIDPSINLRDYISVSDIIKTLATYKRTPNSNRQPIGANLFGLLVQPKKDNKKFFSNINYSYSHSFVPLIKKNAEGKFEVGKAKSKDTGEDLNTLDEYYKDRLTTNVKSYNVGTKENPVYTHTVQQPIQIKPIEKEYSEKEKVELKIQEVKEEPKVEKKIEETAKKTIEETKEDIKKPEVQKEIQSEEVKEKVEKDDTKDIEELIKETLELAESMNLTLSLKDEESVVDDTENYLNGIALSLNIVKDISVKDEQNILSQLVSYFSEKGLSSVKVKEKFKKALEERIELLENQIEKLEEYKDLPKIKSYKSQLTFEVLKAQQVLLNIDGLTKEAFQKAENISFAEKENEEVENEIDNKDEVDESILNDKNYSKGAGEIKHIDKVGVKVRRTFAKIKDPKGGYLGMDKPINFKKAYDYISEYLASSTEDISSINNIIKELELLKEKQPWVQDLINQLKEADEQTLGQFVSNANNVKINAKIIIITRASNGLNELNVLNSNASAADIKIKENWKNNFLNSNMVVGNEINTEVLKELYKKVKEWEKNGGITKQSNEAYLALLTEFGIIINEGTLKSLRKGELYVSGQKGKLNAVEFEQLFDENSGHMLFGKLISFIKENKDKENLSLDDTKNNPTNDLGGVLSNLATLEFLNNPNYASSTRYVGQKLLSEFEHFNYFYQQARKFKRAALKGKHEIFKKLKSISFSSESYILDLLMNDEVFARQFDTSVVDIVALVDRRKKTKSGKDAKIDEITENDYRATLRGYFQDTNQGMAKVATGLPFKIRMAHVPTLTNSDKGRMVLMKTSVFTLYEQADSAFNIEDGKVTFRKPLRNLVYSQVIKGELKRIIHFKKEVKKTDIKDYDKGAVRFNILPELNTLKNKDGKTFSEMLDIHLKNKDIKTEKQLIDLLEADFKDKFIDSLESNIITEASAESNKGINSETYMNKRPGGSKDSTNRLLAELDYTINNIVTQANYMQLFAGDPALYYKSKLQEDGSLETSEKISKGLAINLGKRMTLTIAPGTLLKGIGNKSIEDENYNQIFLQDIEEPAEGLLSLVEAFYGKAVLSKKDKETNESYKSMIEYLKEENTDAEKRGKYIDILKKNFSKIGNYFNIETTDAQEYTTLKEHLRVLEGLGRISPKHLTKIKEVVAEQDKWFKEHGTLENLPEKYDLNKIVAESNESTESRTLMEIMLQPIKPVYTGTIMEDNKNNDVNRMMYIKSSSFPLIPQLTAGRKIDALRINMENNNIARASYQTANKVGAISGEHTIKSFDQEIAPNNVISLNRSNFRIQQDVPYKIKGQVSMLTQMHKLLLGDDVMELKGFVLNGEELSGIELRKKFLEAFSKMVDIKTEHLLGELGLDKNYKPIDKNKSLKKLQKFLMKEAESRGFSNEDKKALEIVDYPSGEKGFRLPLWLSGNSNKFEAMLNSIINKTAFKFKLPGNKFVTGSEAGFQLKDNLDDINKSRIILIGDYEGGELSDFKYTGDKQVKKAQVLMPSKFKMGDKLINLFEDFNEETGEGTYIKRENGKLKLKEDMLDKQLLEQFVSRIPTSSHALGASVEIAGFLPPESGDLIITPKSFITKMGQDFDIDSLTAYQHHYIVRENGRVEKLSESNKDAYIKEQKEYLDYLSSELSTVNFELGVDKNTPLGSFINTLNLGSLTKEEVAEEIKLTKKNLEQDFELKIQENNFIDIHHSVFSHPEMQKNINKVLSMDYAEKQADIIENLNKETNNTFNILSPAYQKAKMKAGSTGKVGIGIYAKGVTFHSLAQQMMAEGNPLYFGIKTKKGVIQVTRHFGRITSNQMFGLKKELPTDNKLDFLRRLISERLDEMTNTATDNEKAQILGRTGLSSRESISVHNFLNTQGIGAERVYLMEDKGSNTSQKEREMYEKEKNNPFLKEVIHPETGNTVYYLEYDYPYLLTSQPIIKRYLELKEQYEGIAEKKSPSTGTMEQEILLELNKEFNPAYTGIIVDGVFLNAEESRMYKEDPKWQIVDNAHQRRMNITSEYMANSIKNYPTVDGEKQMMVLAMFLDARGKAASQKELMDSVDANNLGKSMWEAEVKLDNFKSVKNGESPIINAHKLITNEKDEITTNQGKLTSIGFSLYENLFEGLFPAKNSLFSKIVNNIYSMVEQGSGREFSDYEKVDTKIAIYEDLKKYMTSLKQLSIFNKPADAMRTDLLMDDAERNHKSLSTYLSDIKKSRDPNYSKGLEAIQSNEFMNSLTYENGNGKKPSIIRFNNSAYNDYDVEVTYGSVRELFAYNYPLPPKNGKPYSVYQLLQDMYAYSYIKGDIIQNASTFFKYLPIDFLDETRLKNGESGLQYLQRLGNTENADRLDKEFKNFRTQFFQHNPRYIPAKLGQDKMKALDDTNTIFVIDSETRSKAPNELLYDSKTKTIYKKLEVLEDDTVVYTTIDTLGTSEMSEYSPGKAKAQSLFNHRGERNNIYNSVSAPSIVTSNNYIVPQEGTSMVDVLNSIVSNQLASTKSQKAVARFLMNIVDKKYTIHYDDKLNSAGITKGGTGKVYMNTTGIKTQEDFIRVFLHETIHNVISSYINNFIDDKGNLKENAPAEIQNLQIVYNQYKNHILTDETKRKEYEDFMKKYKAYQKNRGSVKFTETEKSEFYPLINLKEFVATALGNNEDFLKALDKITYLKTEKSFYNKFLEVINSILNKIIKDRGLTEGSLAVETLKASLNLVQRTPIKFRSYARVEATQKKVTKKTHDKLVDEIIMSTFETYEGNRKDGNIVKHIKC